MTKVYPSLKQHIPCTLHWSDVIQFGSPYSLVVTQCILMCQCGLALSVCLSVCLVLCPCRRTESVPNAEGNTPLHLAVINDNPQCVKLLLIHGADIHISKIPQPIQTWGKYLLRYTYVSHAKGRTMYIGEKRSMYPCVPNV